MRKYCLSLLFAAAFVCGYAQQPVTVKKITAGTVKYQGGTNTCWSFSTTSLVESAEIANDKKDIDISELYTSRNLFIEKAKRYILSNGTSLFEAGGLAHDAMYGIEKYGAIPNEFYARKKGVEFSDKSNRQTDEILKNYLDSVLKTKPIDANWLAGFIKKHDDIVGIPPAKFTWEGKEYTPLSFAKDVLKFNRQGYATITSFTHHPFYENFPLEIPDNFLLRENYLNVPLDELIAIAKTTIEKGQSLVVDMDVSNNGWNCGKAGYALFEDKRFYRMSNADTTEMAYSVPLRQQLFETLITQDDHLIHIVGIAKSKGGKLFFILKDSGGDHYGPFKGYDYVSVNYFAINALSITVPVSALDDKYAKLIKAPVPLIN
jgi:bleomycin hydrolase